MRELKREIAAFNRKAAPSLTLRRSGVSYAPYKLVGVPYPWRAETQHTMIAGTTGAGKTQIIQDLVRQVRARGDRAVVWDPMGNYVEAFFDPARDAILNPLDHRCRNWTIFRDAEMAADYDTIAAAMIPAAKHDNPVWTDAARTVFSVAAQLIATDAIDAGDPTLATNKALCDVLLTSSPTEIEKFLKGTLAAPIITTEAARMAAGVRMMLSTYLRPLQMMRDEGEPFSIRHWIDDDKSDAILFLTSRADVHTSLAPLITVWMDVAIKSLLSRPRDRDRTVWFILDEIARLHALPSLKQGMKEGRQYGAAFVLGVQVHALLKELYGADGAQALNGLTRNKLLLSVADHDTAKFYAQDIGRREVRRMEEGVSFGASEIRDGVNLSARDRHELIVMPEELMNLPSLEGYVKMAEGHPVARFRHRFRTMPIVAPAFVPREGVVDLARRVFSEESTDEAKPKAPKKPEQPDIKKRRSMKEQLSQPALPLETPEAPEKTPEAEERDRPFSGFIHDI